MISFRKAGAGVIFLWLLVLVAVADDQSITVAESARANAFFDRAFDAMAARSPQTLTQLGLRQDYDRWDDLSDQHAAGDLALTVAQLAELQGTINYAALDDQAKVSYRLFVREAEQAIEGWRWRYHNYPVNQMSGLHSEVPAFLINYHRVDSVADAEAYVARLNGIGPLFDQLIAQLELRAGRGIMPPRFVFPLVIASCREVITGAPFDQSEQMSSLLKDFTDKVGSLPGVDEGARRGLIAQARKALVEVVRPAYEKLIAVLRAEEKKATDDDGVWKFPDGDEYYAFVLRRETTTSATAAQIHELGLREVARIHRDMAAIIKRVGFKGVVKGSPARTLQAFFKFIREDPQFYYPTTPEGKEAYMRRATACIEAMRARLGEFFITQPKAPLVVKPVEPFREEGSAAAFYEDPAPDGSRPGTYFVNTVDMQGLPIFELETLAHHEAIPGHHMQIVIAQELANMPKFRRYGGNTAFMEGWALYAEYFPKEFGFYTDPYMDFGRLYDELLRAVRLVVDTGLHAQHWTRQQVIDYFRHNTPNPERDIAVETNRYVVWPGQATAYKVGMMKILELREYAKQELGAQFDLRAYHDLVLGNGALPLDLLEENVRAWVAASRR